MNFEIYVQANDLIGGNTSESSKFANYYNPELQKDREKDRVDVMGTMGENDADAIFLK